jgi:O-antigen ligase
MVAYILIGHYAVSRVVMISSSGTSRPLLVYNAVYVAVLCVAILHKFVTGKQKAFFSPMLLLMVLIAVMISLNNPHTAPSIDALLNFVVLVLLPCIYLWVCTITVKDLSKIYGYGAIFGCLLLVTTIYYYTRLGNLKELNIPSKDLSQLYTIAVARSLTLVLFFLYFLMRDRLRGIIPRTASFALFLATLATLVLIGERQAIIAVLFAPVVLKIISLKRPVNSVLTLLGITVFFFVLFSYIIPYAINEGPLKRTNMGKYLEQRYYDKKNIMSLNGRIEINKITLKIIAENPFWGVGFSNYSDHLSHRFHYPINMNFDPHNLWLLIVVELGFFGIIAVVSIFWFFLKSIWEYRSLYGLSGSREFETLCLLGISVFLFSLVGVTWSSSFTFFGVAILLEKCVHLRKAEQQSQNTVTNLDEKTIK